MLKNKSNKMSKTKLGTLLIGVSAILGTVGGYLSGAVDMGSALQALIYEVGGIFAIFGVRDLPILNGGKR